MKNPAAKQTLQSAAAVLFWLAVWQCASLLIGQELFLPAPLAVLRALGALALTGGFWYSIATSLLRIALGFFLGFATGAVLAALAAFHGWLRRLLQPLMQLISAIPVASFVILALLWFSSKNLSVFTSFLMVLPVIYNGTLAGLQAADGALQEMARVFGLSRWRRFLAVYLPALLPSLLSAARLALGLCWKSGVAAEVIGLPRGSIGERLYQAKIYLLTPEMFAWTALVIFLSWAFGRVVLAALRALGARLQRGLQP